MRARLWCRVHNYVFLSTMFVMLSSSRPRSPQCRISKSSSALRRGHSDSMEPFSPSSVSTSVSSPSSVVVTLLDKVPFSLPRSARDPSTSHPLPCSGPDSLNGKFPFTVPSNLRYRGHPDVITLSSSCVFTCSTLSWARGHDFASRRLSPRDVRAPWFSSSSSSSSSQSRFQINSAQPQTLCFGFI